MKRNNSVRWLRTALALATATAALSSVNASESTRDEGEHRMEVTSMTFTDHATLPLSTVDNIVANGLNACTADGSPGGNQSPQLQWTHVPHGTRSFVVILYDPTASFTHWGMYNIAPGTRMLPANAGAAGSTFGTQVFNDFPDQNYDGPCPPPGVAPVTHQYVFTVYALDTELTLASSANFPANADTLYQALLHAAREGHILASGSITGLFSSTPAQ